MKFIPIVLMTLTLSGCASIMGDKTQALPIDIQPEGTKITVKDNTGMTVYTGTSPTTVTLNKSDGSYFGKKITPFSLKMMAIHPNPSQSPNLSTAGISAETSFLAV